MIAILKYFPSKIIALVAVCTIALLPIHIHAAEKNNRSSSCEYRTFNIKTNNKATGLELLGELAEVCDFSIVVKDTEAEKVLAKNLNGVNIKNLSLDEVFQIIIQDNDLFYSYDKNYLKISALSTKSFKVDYISSIREGKAVINASVDATPTETSTSGTKNTVSQGQNTISSNESFDFWKTISTELTSVLNTGGETYKAQSPIINVNAGMITVTATKRQLDRVSEYIDVLKERLHRQVLIDVSIVSVLLNNSNTSGVDWSKFSLNIGSNSIFNNSNQGTLSASNPNTLYNSASTGTANASSNLNNLTVVNDVSFSIAGLIDFLGSSGETKVVSSPKVLTMNNQQALITIGDNVNYRVPETTNAASTTGTATLATTYTNYSIFIGVLLNITPEISEDNEIILRINPSVSTFKYSADDVKTTDPRVIAPDTSEKKLSTVVKVKDGSTIILGGLITNNKSKQDTSVPLLSSIPLLGEAFKHSADTLSSNELVFVITPRIIGAKGTDKATLKDLGYSQKINE